MARRRAAGDEPYLPTFIPSLPAVLQPSVRRGNRPTLLSNAPSADRKTRNAPIGAAAPHFGSCSPISVHPFFLFPEGAPDFSPYRLSRLTVLLLRMIGTSGKACCGRRAEPPLTLTGAKGRRRSGDALRWSPCGRLGRQQDALPCATDLHPERLRAPPSPRKRTDKKRDKPTRHSTQPLARGGEDARTCP